MCENIILEDFEMEKYTYDEQSGLWYELEDNYYIPYLKLPAEKEEWHIGVWGKQRLRHICKNKKVF